MFCFFLVCLLFIYFARPPIFFPQLFLVLFLFLLIRGVSLFTFFLVCLFVVFFNLFCSTCKALSLSYFCCKGEFVIIKTNKTNIENSLFIYIHKIHVLILIWFFYYLRGLRMVVEFTTTYAISAYHHQLCEFESRSRRLRCTLYNIMW